MSGQYNFPGITKIAYFLNTQLSDKTQYIVHVFWLNYQNHEEKCVGLENLDKRLIGV